MCEQKFETCFSSKDRSKMYKKEKIWITSLETLYILIILFYLSERTKSTNHSTQNKSKLRKFTDELVKERRCTYRKLDSRKDQKSRTRKERQEFQTAFIKQEIRRRNTRSVQRKEKERLTCPKEYSCSSNGKESRLCQCDSYCTFFNDCCADYQHYFPNATAKTPRLNLKSEQFTCTNEFFKSAISVVDRCPNNVRGSKVSLKCEGSKSWSANDIRELIPVHGRNTLVYRNEYCAKCNEENEIEHFEVKIACDILPPSKLTKVDEKIKFALKYCGNKSIDFQTKDNYETRECFPELVKCCSNRSLYYERCVKGPVGVVTANHTNYRNIWCVQCSRGDRGEYLEEAACGPKTELPNRKRLKIASITLVLDITNNGFSSTRVHASCEKSFFDSKLELCVRSSPKKTPKKKNIDKYLVAIWFNSKKFSARMLKKNVYSALTRTFSIEKSQMDKLHFIKRQPNHNYFLVAFRLRLTNEQTLRIAKQENRTKDDKKEKLALEKPLSLKKLLFFTTEFNITMRKQTFTVFKTTYRQLACINKRTYSHEKYALLPNGSYFINSSGKSYDERQVFFEDSTAQNISICEQVVLSNCHGYQISWNESEYTKFDNLSIMHNGTNKTYDFGNYDIQDNKVVVCMFPSTRTSIPRPSNEHLTYLTLTGFVLSLTGLFLVIVTYAIFSELRSIPGKNVLNLCVSLFLAQLIWLTAVKRSEVPVLCHVTAMVEHYLFLVSFVAMAVIAYHTHWIFSRKTISKAVSRKDENRTALFYCAITWCFPGAFVGTCAVLDQKGIYAIYTNDQICWFKKKEAQEYLFVLPVGAILFFNMVLFILSVAHIQKKRSGNVVMSLLHRTRPRQANIWIYLKISTLMGFGWLFGFLNIIVNSTLVFSYLFVTVASLQGVYIALAFIINQRVMKMYKNLAKRKKPKSKELTEQGVLSTNFSVRSKMCATQV